MKLALRIVFAVVIAVAIGVGAWMVHADRAYGPRASFAILSGAAFGFLLQRSRFCWFCNLRDLFQHKNGRAALGILAALAVGTVGYAAMYGNWLQDPSTGAIPTRGFIGPVSWVVALGGFVFGIGMSLSGSCISAHLYRLGEGSVLSPFALGGVVVGAMLGYLVWDRLYLATLQEAKPIWLPTHVGYAGSMAMQLGVFAFVALLIYRYWLPERAVTSGQRSWSSILRAVFVERWPGTVGGVLIGMLAVLVLVRTQPLGVTAQINRVSRDLGTSVGLLDTKMLGLDGFSGCVAPAASATWSGNAMFVLAMVLASLASAVLAGQFKPKWERPRAMLAATVGGVLLGWGAMVSIGCSVGTAMSGVMAFSVAGWIFLFTMIVGTAVSLPLRRVIVDG
jgi:uncharacterized protein